MGLFGTQDCFVGAFHLRVVEMGGGIPSSGQLMKSMGCLFLRPTSAFPPPAFRYYMGRSWKEETHSGVEQSENDG